MVVNGNDNLLGLFYCALYFRYVHMDNVGIKSPVATVIMENETVHYEFNEIEVAGYSRVLLFHPTGSNVTAVIHCFMGDRTGQFHVRDNQKIWVEYIESFTNYTEAPISYIIDDGTEVIFPTEVHLQGINSTVDGKLSNIHHLYIEDDCFLVVSSTTQTAQMESNVIIEETDPGNFSLPTINIKNAGIFEFRKIENDFTITAARMELKFNATVYMNQGFVEVGDIDIEAESLLSLEGKGYEAEQGPGAGSGNAGGSYGGVAGGATDDHAYGSVFRPIMLGSGGSGSDGGAGGGFVVVTVGKSMHVDGQIDTYGADASGTGGGGSGGSILIHAYNFSGHGSLDASGGNGGGSGYGGSGGRIAILIEYQNNYGGLYLAHGGNSGYSNKQNAGGPGTVYKYESRRGPTYRDLKYDPRLNNTIIEPEHTKLTVENYDLHTTNPAVIMENGSKYYEFDEVQVEGYSYVHFYHPTNIDIVTVLIHELTGNKQGMVRVQDHQQLTIHFVASTHTYLDAPCGFHVDAGGEIVLPTSVIILTEKTIVGGGIVGVENLIVERNAEFVIDKNASTSDAFNFQQGVIQSSIRGTDTGHLRVPNMSVNNLALFTIDLNPRDAHIDIAEFTIRNGGLVTANTQMVYIESTNLTVESGGKITGVGQGSQAGQGNGPGRTTSDDSAGGAFSSSGEYL